MIPTETSLLEQHNIEIIQKPSILYRGHCIYYWGDQTMQMDGDFEGFPLFVVHEVWVAVL